MARIAATRGIDESCGDVPAEARAWLTLAEIEMGLENLPAAGQALERALERDAKLITGQLIGAVLAELRGHHEQSAAHLTQLEILTSAAVEGGEDAAHFIQLKQQVAGLRERLGQYDAAAATWRSLTEENPQRLEVLAERGSFLLRRGRDEEAETIASQLLTTDLHQDLVMGSEFQRFLRDLALRRSSRQDAGLGLRTLQKYVQCLAPTTRLLLAQLAFISGDHALCTQQLDMLATSDERRAASLIRIRLLLVQNNVSAARTLAQTFWDEGHDQDAAVILAEILSGQGDYAQALEILDQADLPTIPSLDRGLLTAYLALELSGENACLARLGRLRPEPRSGLMRVFAQAWPGVWNERLPFHTDDLLTVPAYSRAVGHLALALEKSGRLREAGLLLETMVERLGTHDTAAAARLAAIAVAPLCRTGQRRRALSMARSSGSLRALLRCLMPW